MSYFIRVLRENFFSYFIPGLILPIKALSRELMLNTDCKELAIKNPIGNLLHFGTILGAVYVCAMQLCKRAESLSIKYMTGWWFYRWMRSFMNSIWAISSSSDSTLFLSALLLGSLSLGLGHLGWPAQLCLI